MLIEKKVLHRTGSLNSTMETVADHRDKFHRSCNGKITVIEYSNSFSMSESVPLKFEESVEIQNKNENLRKWALALCYLSVVINFSMCVAGFVLASVRNSPATFAFAADCVLDFFSSAVVIWRYFGSPYTTYSTTREKKACISLGVLFVIAGVGVIIQGIVFISMESKPKWFAVLMILALFGVVACFILGTAKLVLYLYMNSKSLFLDGLNSYLSGAFALVIVVSDAVYCYDNRVWYLDPLLSIIFSVGLLTYGIYIIYTHTRPVDLRTSEV